MQNFNRRAPTPNIVDGVPVLKPLRVPSARFGGNGSRPGSRSGTPKHYTADGRAKRRRKALLVFQILLLVAVGMLMFRKVDDLQNQDIIDSSGPVRKRQLIATKQKTDLPKTSKVSVFDEGPTNSIKSFTHSVSSESDEYAEMDSEVSMYPDDSLISESFAHPTGRNSENPNSYFYRFTNVRIAEDGNIEFYGGHGVDSHNHLFYYDVALGNGSSPLPPTTLLLSGAHRKRRSISIRYLPQSRPKSACKKWIDGPSFLLNVRSPASMWGTWIEGLLPAFQTLRELGYLPLMEVSPDGKTQDYNAGIDTDSCPRIIDPLTGAAKRTVDCTQTDTSHRKNMKIYCGSTDPWCVLGVWPHAAYMRSPHPAILYVDDSIVDNPWGGLYSAIGGGGVHSWNDKAGYCLRNLVVGYSRTLSLVAPPSPVVGGEGGVPAEEQFRMTGAVEAFSRFIRSALHRLEVNNAIEFEGYGSRAADRLRRGIGLGYGKYIDVVFKPFKPIETPVPGDEDTEVAPPPLDPKVIKDWEQLRSSSWVFTPTRKNLTDVRDIPKIIELAAVDASPSPFGPPSQYNFEFPRPVVTYISKWSNLTTAILNDRQILWYIYWRYNVTLRVTTMTEHEGVVAQTLSTSDVVIGPPGSHWAQAVFLKPGAVTLQLLPFGWRRKDGSLLSGNKVASLVHLRKGTHVDWVNPYPQFSFFKRSDFLQGEEFVEHPVPHRRSQWSAPGKHIIHPAWLHANTYADLCHLGPYIDEAMKLAQIPKMAQETVKLQMKREKMEESNQILRDKRLEEGMRAYLDALAMDEDDLAEEDDEDFRKRNRRLLGS